MIPLEESLKALNCVALVIEDKFAFAFAHVILFEKFPP